MKELNGGSCCLVPGKSLNDRFAEKLRQMKPDIGDNAVNDAIGLVSEIRRLKREKDAVILSHYYMPAFLQVKVEDGGVADVVGDSLALSIAAQKVSQKNIVFCGVRFMAETAALLNPDSHVFIPDLTAGCSLAESINPAQIRRLREIYPGAPVIAYINTYAETKAEADICVTSRNAVDIARSFKEDTLIFLPDFHMGRNLAKVFEGLGKRLILWNGSCEVHEQFRHNISALHAAYPDAKMLLHWEVPEATVKNALAEAGGVLGSTSDIIRFAGSSDSKKFILASECDLGATLKGMYPDKEFITPCISCRFMKKINLENTLHTLKAIGHPEERQYKIDMDTALMERAAVPVKRMLALS